MLRAHPRIPRRACSLSPGPFGQASFDLVRANHKGPARARFPTARQTISRDSSSVALFSWPTCAACLAAPRLSLSRHPPAHQIRVELAFLTSR